MRLIRLFVLTRIINLTTIKRSSGFLIELLGAGSGEKSQRNRWRNFVIE
jgi:hypothetical protein